MSVGRNRLRMSCFKVQNADLGDLGATLAQLPSFTSVPWKENTHHFVMGTGVGAIISMSQIGQITAGFGLCIFYSLGFTPWEWSGHGVGFC